MLDSTDCTFFYEKEEVIKINIEVSSWPESGDLKSVLD